jgi:hypothetical protein
LPAGQEVTRRTVSAEPDGFDQGLERIKGLPRGSEEPVRSAAAQGVAASV